MRHTLKGRQRLAKGMALLHILPGFTQRRLRHGDALQADQGTAEVETLHHLLETAAFITETVAHRHADIVENQTTAPNGTLTVIGKPTAMNAGRRHVDQHRS